MLKGGWWAVVACLGVLTGCSARGPSASLDGVAPVRVASSALDRSISSETLLDDPVTVSFAPQVGVAADPSGFLLTWLDLRGATEDFPTHIESTHVSSAGVVSNPSGTVLSKGRTDLRMNPIPAAFNGQYYLVVWEKGIPDPNGVNASETVENEIDAVRVAPSGVPLDDTPIVIATLDPTIPSQIDAVLSDGSGFFIAWEGQSSVADSSFEKGRFVSFSGSTPVLAPIFDFGFFDTDPSQYAFVFDGNKYAVAYLDISDYGRWTMKRFTSAGLGTDPGLVFNSIPGCNSGYFASVHLASNGNGELLVAYSGVGLNAGAGCVGATKALQIGSDSQPKFAPITLENVVDPLATVTYLGGKYLVAGQQIDPATNVASAATYGVPVSSFSTPTFACNATTCLTAVAGGVSRMTTQGVLLDIPSIEFDKPASPERQPLVAFGAGEYLAVWQDGDATAVVHAGRVSASGASLDPTPLLITAQVGAAIDVSFDGTDFVVLWGVFGPNSPSLRVTRVSPAGVVKDPAGIVIHQEEAGVEGVFACGPNDCLVAWHGSASDGHGGFVAAGVSATRIAASGTLLDSPPIQVLASPSDAVPIMLAPSGSGYVLQYSGGAGGLLHLDATGHAAGSPLPGNAELMHPCGSNFLVFHPAAQHPGTFGTYTVSLLDPTGSVLLDPVNLGGTVKYQFDVASTATGCAIAWPQTGPTSDDIYANFIQSDGSGANPQAIPVATDAFNETSPALAFDGESLLVAYSHLVTSAPYGNFRIAARILAPSQANSGGAGAGGEGGELTSPGGSSVGGSLAVGGSGSGEAGAGAAATGGGGASGAGQAGAGAAATGEAGGGGGGGVAVGSGGADAGGAAAGGTSGTGKHGGGGCTFSPRSPAPPVGYGFALLLLALAGRRRKHALAR